MTCPESTEVAGTVASYAVSMATRVVLETILVWMLLTVGLEGCRLILPVENPKLIAVKGSPVIDAGLLFPEDA